MAIEIERVRLVDQDIAIEGRFDLPGLARLSGEDQVFIAAFVRCHGSIKQMEKFFGVSYPTIKNRLNRLATQLPFVEVDSPPGGEDPPLDAGQSSSPGGDRRPTPSDLLARLERGELTARDVLNELKLSPDKERP